MAAWVQQAWYGPTAAVTAAKDALVGDPRVAGMVPEVGQPPTPCDEGGTEAMFGFVSTELVELPPTLKRANPAMLVRIMGTF